VAENSFLNYCRIYKRNKPIYYTKVFWFSPELNGNGDPYGSQGIELDAYPTLRSLVIGANLKFNTMKEIYISLFVVSAYFISGCSNDYLDVDQTETISTKDIALFNNDQGAATFVNAIYNKF
jgi:hypothetical protein